MLKAIISGAPEPSATVSPVGTVAAGAPVISARFTYIEATVGLTAAILPSAAPGAWFFITQEVGGTTARVFTQVDDTLYVAGVAYDNTTPYQVVSGKALLVMTGGNFTYYGVALG